MLLVWLGFVSGACGGGKEFPNSLISCSCYWLLLLVLVWLGFGGAWW